MPSLDSLKSLKTLQIDDKTYHYFSLPDAAKSLGDLDKLPMSLKVLLENLLRWEDEKTVTGADLKAIAAWLKERRSDREIQYRPARVLMQDFTGVPAVVDLAAMRAAMAKAGGDPQRINPLSPVDLVIDHSVMVDKFGSASAFEQNVDIEMQRNGERYAFLRWGQSAFDNFSVVPPGTGICHQVNLEYLGRTVWTKDEDGRTYAFPDTLVGTDSHTTMINGLGVLGWGVGGIEAEAAMLGQPVSMLIPEVIGFKLTGKLKEGITATDLVLTVTQMLRKKGVVGKFVEFYGDGLADLPLADRATIANMAPEYGATCGFFPVDDVTLDDRRLSGRPPETVKLVEAYCKTQGLWRLPGKEPAFTDSLALDMSSVEASLAGPKRPQDRVSLPNVGQAFSDFLDLQFKPTNKEEGRLESEGGGGVAVGNADLVGETDYEYDGHTTAAFTFQAAFFLVGGFELQVEEVAEGLADVGQGYTVLWTFWPSQAGFDAAHVQRQAVSEHGLLPGIAPQALGLGVGLDQLYGFCRATGQTQVVQRHLIHREKAAGGAIFRGHVGDGGAVGQG